MLSVRGKTILIILGVVLGIAGFTLGAGLLVGHVRLLGVVHATLFSVSRIAASMVSSEIGRLKEESRYIAEQVAMAGEGGAQEALDAQVAYHPCYLSFSVMSLDGSALHAGCENAFPPFRAGESAYAARAFAGETVITTTSHIPGGGVAMRIWTPIDAGRVLIATLPGLYLSEFLSPHEIWETGTIFVIDGAGTHIAGNRHHYRVLERRNYIERGGEYLEPRRIGQLHRRIIESEMGGTQQIDSAGRRLFSAFHAIQGSDNWSAVIIAPLAESPIFHVREILFLSAALIVLLGSIAAIRAANVIAEPYEKMAEMKRSAEEASYFKTQFLAAMSHEIRMPLSAIIGLSEVELGNAGLHKKSLRNIKNIHRAGVDMLGIISDLLDISKIESGKLALVPAVYDVSNMIDSAIQLNIVRLGSKPVQFHLRMSGAVPAKLKGDELRIKQIFNNLLSNAFKFTETGFVEWSIFCAREGDRVKITSTIQDTGIGIRQEDQGKLFNDYSQVSADGKYRAGGTGLGLSITKKLVGLMGGSIALESDYLKGSSFTVEFFQEAAGDELIDESAAANLSRIRRSAQRLDQGQAREQKIVRADLSYARILVVDDMLINLDIAKGLLKPYRINVDTAVSGSEAVALIMRGRIRYDAIFMDHMMPDMDGAKAAQFIREIDSDYAKNIPIIALTANAAADDDAAYLEMGFQASLSKPIDVFRLDQVLGQWVRDRSKEGGEGDALAAIADFAARHAIPGLNLAAGFAYFQNDMASYLAVLRSFAKHTPEKISRAKAAQSSLASYRIAAHSLKGSSKGIGAEKLGEMAEKLEKAAASGDHGYIRESNPAFIEAAEKLIADIDSLLAAVAWEDSAGKGAEEKPEKEWPEPELLAEALRACADYDMLALRKTAEALGAFRYACAPGLAQWVTEQLHSSNFDAIRQRILSLRNALSPIEPEPAGAAPAGAGPAGAGLVGAEPASAGPEQPEQGGQAEK